MPTMTKSSENIFFDTSKLKYRGQNVIIGKTVRIRYPELVELHDNSIIDDFVYISTGLSLGPHCGIEAGCVIMGGRNRKVSLEKYSTICSNSSVMCSVHNYQTGLHIFHYPDFEQGIEQGNIMIKDHVIVGAQCTILPGVTLHSGARVGANSLIKQDLAAWTIYAGVPARAISTVDKQTVLASAKNFEQINI
jgi:galactoside O-acetyltransferase